MPIEIKTLETVYQGYATIRLATLAAPDGEILRREIEDHGRAASVLPYDPDRRTALLVRLPRAPVIFAGGPAELLEAPAGMVEAGEDPAACVRREALEEVGVTLGELEPIGAPFSSAGVSTERVDLFLAPYSAADRIAPGGGAPGEQEGITVVELPLGELWALVEDRRIEDLKTLALVYVLRVRRPELFEGGGR